MSKTVKLDSFPEFPSGDYHSKLAPAKRFSRFGINVRRADPKRRIELAERQKEIDRQPVFLFEWGNG